MENKLEFKAIHVNENIENFREVFRELKVGDRIKWNRGKDTYKGLITEKFPNYFWAVSRGYEKERPSKYMMGGIGKYKPLNGAYISEHGFELKDDRIRYWGNNGGLFFKNKFPEFEGNDKKYFENHKLMKNYGM